MPIETDNDIINRNRKSTLFCLIFGRHENRKWTLDLYNAINNSHYTDPDEITFNTEKDFKRQQLHDVEKNYYCLNNNITLIRIPYTQYSKLSIIDLLPNTSNFIIKDDSI